MLLNFLSCRPEAFSGKRVWIYRPAESADWPEDATWISRQAQKCAKLHDRRINESWVSIIDQIFCNFPENPTSAPAAHTSLQVDQSPQPSPHVRTHNRHPL